MPREKVTLANLGGGSAAEKFEDCFNEVLKDIRDPNKDATATRTVTIKVTIKPDSQRRRGALLVDATSKLAPGLTHNSAVDFLEKDGEVLAVGEETRQLTFDDIEPQETEGDEEEDGVVELNVRKEM